MGFGGLKAAGCKIRCYDFRVLNNITDCLAITLITLVCITLPALLLQCSCAIDATVVKSKVCC